MSQFDFGTIDPNTKSGTQLASDLNVFRDALNSGHSGASRPAYAQAGMFWVRTVSSTQWDLVFYDGTADYTLRSVNPTTSEIYQIPKEDVEGLEQAITDVAKAVLKDTDANNTGAALIPSGTTAQEPPAPSPGMFRHNATLDEFRGYRGGDWKPIFTGGTLEKAINEAPLVTLASAATVDIGAAAANTISISGSVAITSLGTISPGARRTLVFQANPVITHNATSLILPGGANITAAAGDVAEFVSLGGGNWRCTDYTKANGMAIVGESINQDQLATAWVNFNGTGTVAIRDSFNVSSITDVAVGVYQINFSANMANANYAVAGSGRRPENVANPLDVGPRSLANGGSFDVTGFTLIVRTPDGSANDPDLASVIVFGGK